VGRKLVQPIRVWRVLVHSCYDLHQVNMFSRSLRQVFHDRRGLRFAIVTPIPPQQTFVIDRLSIRGYNGKRKVIFGSDWDDSTRVLLLAARVLRAFWV
jgi:hypothetical protein